MIDKKNPAKSLERNINKKMMPAQEKSRTRETPSMNKDNKKILKMGFCSPKPTHETPFSSSSSSSLHSFLAPNNPRLTAQSFSPITGVGSGMISQFLSG